MNNDTWSNGDKCDKGFLFKVAFVGVVLTNLQALKDRSYALDILNGLFIPKYEVNSAR